MSTFSISARYLGTGLIRFLRHGAVVILASLALMPARADSNEDLRALGEYLSAGCVTCHQLSGEHDGIPPIVGWDATAFQAVMNEYRDKTRTHPVMRTIASSLSEQDVMALALYFGSLEPRSN